MNLSTNTVLVICVISGFMIVWLVSPWRGVGGQRDTREQRKQGERVDIPTVVVAVPTLMLCVAFGKLPYSYYQSLRFIVCAALFWIASALWKGRRHLSSLIFCVVALLYNPIFPLHLIKSSWGWINAATIVLLLAALGVAKSSELQPNSR